MAVYRHFPAVRTVFCAFLTGVILLGAGGFALAGEQDSLYTVEKVEVDVTAANAVEARNKALDEAQVKAYRMLAEKFYTPEQMATFVDPDPLTVSSMVQDFEVTNEQLSKVRYKGVFTVRFRPTAIRQHFPVNDYNSLAGDAVSVGTPTLILPYYQYGNRTVLWDPANIWLKAWNAAQAETGDLASPAIPSPADKNLIVPIGDLLDVSQMPDDKALTYDPQMLDQMMGRYGADEAAIPIAVPKNDGLEVSLYQARRTGPDYAQTLFIKGVPGEAPAALYARAADQLRALMRGNWKNKPAPIAMPDNTVPLAQNPNPIVTPTAQPSTGPVGPAQTFNGRVTFATVQEWVRLKTAIERTPGVRSVVVKGLKPREAQITLSYAGDAVNLATAMQRVGVVMRSAGQNGGYFPGSNGAQIFEFSAGAARY